MVPIEGGCYLNFFVFVKQHLNTVQVNRQHHSFLTTKQLCLWPQALRYQMFLNPVLIFNVLSLFLQTAPNNILLLYCWFSALCEEFLCRYSCLCG